MFASTLTTKARTTIPQAVRSALGLQIGDEIAYSIEDGRVAPTRRLPERDSEDPFAAFHEWDSIQDAEAHGSL